jgi:chromosome segregation ATPase
MNIDDRIKTLAAEIAEANAKAEAFSRQADKKKAYADKKEAYAEKLEAECEEKDQEIALLKSKIEKIERELNIKR